MLTLTHLPRLGPIPEVPGKDKTLHFVAYFVAGIVCLLAFGSEGSRRKRMIFILVSLAGLGAVDEITQPFVNRSCDLFDWLADVAGLVAAGVVYLSMKFKRKRIDSCDG